MHALSHTVHVCPVCGERGSRQGTGVCEHGDGQVQSPRGQAAGDSGGLAGELPLRETLVFPSGPFLGLNEAAPLC